MRFSQTWTRTLDKELMQHLQCHCFQERLHNKSFYTNLFVFIYCYNKSFNTKICLFLLVTRLEAAQGFVWAPGSDFLSFFCTQQSLWKSGTKYDNSARRSREHKMVEWLFTRTVGRATTWNLVLASVTLSNTVVISQKNQMDLFDFQKCQKQLLTLIRVK